MLLKSKKEKIVKDLGSDLKDAASVVFVNFHGLTVGPETNLRKDLRNQGVGYKVSRKTLLKRALNGLAEGEIPNLNGEVAVAYSKDSIAPAREIYNFQKSQQRYAKYLGRYF